jgi:type II secretory pathway predicted ATPase ExeA
MYTEFFNLKHIPFSRTTFPQHFFLDESRRRVLSLLKRTIDNRGAAALLIGEPDTGKSTLLNALQNNSGTFSPVQLSNTLLSAEDFRAAIFQAIFKKKFLPQDRDSFFKDFGIYLQQRMDKGSPCLLIIDEAQGLGTDVLQELGSFLQMEHLGRNLLSVLLSGHPHLKDKLADPECEELSSHVQCCCELRPLDRGATRRYISECLKRAGAGWNIFSAGATGRIFRYSRGHPGMVNTLADKAMLLAFRKKCSRINKRMVDEASADLVGIKPGNAARQWTILKGSAIFLAFAAMLMVWYEPVLRISNVLQDARHPVSPKLFRYWGEVPDKERLASNLQQVDEPVPVRQGGPEREVLPAGEEKFVFKKEETEEGRRITEAHICRRVANRKPVGASDFFDSEVKRVSCFTRVSGAGIDHVTHVWYYGDVETARVRLQVKSTDWRTFSSKRIPAGQVGQWHVDVTDPDGNILRRLDFEVR